MNNVELYQKYNRVQAHEALQFLEEYTKKLHWKDGATVMDIGSGDGKVTATILKNYLPPGTRVVGTDISERMVNFANKTYASDDIEFEVLDIEGELPAQMRGKFQQVFSFFALQWPEKIDVVYSNIYNMLADEGECVLMFLGRLSFYDALRNFSRNSRWSPWMQDMEKYLSPYHDCQDPEKEIKRLMHKIGFTDVDVKHKSKSFLFDSAEEKMKTLSAVNAMNIPNELFDEYMEEVMQEICRIDRLNRNIDCSLAMKTLYFNVIYIYAKK
ncbi:juvenile hormone acid O-methyltransferase-like [Zerene cesonia]|uniref:juvenile hormone acid O-methyltransferase-like n=1 Tax=Zerene cesonia TaxID=33412 RepID=UPI0018E56303|nr:juvenile hormone acid O-methyltransferase-like [Zerene cesonia]